MNSETFIKTHQKTWERFAYILDRISKKGPAGLTEEELKIFGFLFRRVTAHLAYAQVNYSGHEMTYYLNNLVIRAHAHIYKQETLGIGTGWKFFRRSFPRLVIEQKRFIFVAGLVVLLGIVIGYFLHFYQPVMDSLIIPDAVKNTIDTNLGHGRMGSEWPLYERPAISAWIMINNIKVGILSFALGFSCGVGTLLVLFTNGLMIGVLGAIFQSKGIVLDFWSLILPHGILELLAIFICGGAGLVLAQALVKPGDYKRRDALLVQGKIAIKLVIGTIPLFIVAALIEGFITPSRLPNFAKLAVAAVSLILFFFYLFIGNRGAVAKRRSHADNGKQ